MRYPNKKEMRTLIAGLRYWGGLEILRGREIVLRGREVLLIPSELRDLVLSLKPYYCGIKIGDLSSKKFHLSLEGAYLISKVSSKKKVFVNEKAEMLVLYGRDVFGNSVTDATQDIRENDEVMICNSFNEAIAIGRARVSWERMKEPRVVVENLRDRGWYTRECGTR
ncbi:MAG: ribosome subunit biosis protein [Archaeoglobi archaeon]|nr:ribosome subunit biosis protein [Archaeoglobi archaeon]MDK2782212.1 ribosome subunit biosis protein [Archaeoglobi archaeon]